jgi:multiple sugar transport system substrate-binding protein
VLLVLVLLFAALIATGCGGSADDAGAVPVIGFMTWRDQTGFDQRMFDACEKSDGNVYSIEPVAMGPTTDAAREQLTRRLAAGDETIDLINLDTIWTAEFSDAGWLMDLTARIEPIKDQYVPAAMESAVYKDKYWALPVGTNAALLFYRTDLVEEPPTTWEEVAKISKEVVADNPEMSGVVFQGAPYEGGTVDALEFIYSSGAKVISEDGKESMISDGDGTAYAMSFLDQMRKDKLFPKVVTTFFEEDSRLAFQNGTAVFMRNWPYAYAIMNSDEASKIQGKFDVAPLPGFEGRDAASVLGGQNFGIAASTDEPELAWKAIECLAKADNQRIKAVEKGELPTLLSMYDDPEVREKLPFIDVSRAALDNGVNRPISPYYNDMTNVINRAYNDVLGGRATPDEAVERMDRGVQAAVDGRPEI